MKQQQKSWALWIFLFLLMVLLWQATSQSIKKEKIVDYSSFLHQVQSKFVENVTFLGDLTIKGKYKETFENGGDFLVTAKTDEYTKKYLLDNGVALKYQKEQSGSLFTTLLVQWAPMLILFVLFWFFLKQLQSGGGKAMSFGKSKAKLLNNQDKKVTFDDVSGVQEAKEELVEVVDFLKDPKKYTSLGGKIPKGCLLVGPPGTGKTLLARAVAGEADVPFFSISGSDFVEMFVGVGASRVRDLFEQGKKQAPCIIFIDEIDAVGRHRGQGMGGGNDEREQTLNQLLVEMDGFESNEGVIIMAATNRMDVLDPALLRPGRFDRRVTVGAPDVRGRLGILKVHSKITPLNEDVNLEVVAKGTPGFTGADLANLVNEAALTAARLGKKQLDMSDFEAAKDKVLMGPERRSMVISDKEKRITAYHEAGHTLVGMKLPHTDPIHKVSIMPRGGALGVTQTLPSEDMHNLTKSKSENLIAFLMGGRCAEEIEFNEITNGASNDIERATQLAHSMVCSWGMSSVMGPRNFSKPGGSPFGGQGMDSIDYSEDTANAIDSEINVFIDANYKLALKILTDNKEALDRLSEGLILWETLDNQQCQDLIDGKDIGLPIIEPEKEEEKEEKKEEEVDSTSVSDTKSEDSSKDTDPVPAS